MSRKTRSWACLVLCTLLTCAGVAAETKPALLDQGRLAEAAENYQAAIDLYRQAMDADPADPEAARALAELFTGKGLHDLALPVWKEVVRRASGDPASWLALAQTWSYLDNNAQSVRTLDEARRRFPLDRDTVQSLAWMLFKTEEFRRGVSLVETFIRDNKTDRSLEMTLGTLYSSLFQYDLSRVHYLKSIDLAPGRGSEEKNFRSVAWYNLSLLERTFYQFDLADEAIRKSIAEEDRPAGELAWGELFQSRRDFAEARRLYEKAVAADETPLGRFDLARLYQQFGYLDEAEAQLVQVEAHKDDTWIYNYGVTKDKVKRDLHEAWADLHRSRYHSLDFLPRPAPWDWGTWAASKLREAFLWWYHDQTWKSLLVKLSDSSMAVRNSPEAWVGLTLAHRDRPGLALKYLALVKDHEVPRNPRSRASYLVEEGMIRRSADILGQALIRLQDPWENEDRERALTTLVQVRRDQGRVAEARKVVSTLFVLNPGALPAQGWGLPVQVRVFGREGDRTGWARAFAAYAGQTGWDASADSRPGVGWTIDVRAEASSAGWALRDPDGNVFRSGVVRIGSGDQPSAVAGVFWAIHKPQ